MNIWLVSIFEQTPIDKVYSTRFISIGNEAVRRGHTVTFFASTFKHNTKNQRFNETTVIDIEENYKLVFVKSIGYKKNISFRRLISHYFFASEALNEMQAYPKPDVILMAYPPIGLADKVSSWAKKNNIPVVLDIIDPWPDFSFAFPSYIKPFIELLTFPLNFRLERALKGIQAVTSISKEYIQWAISKVNSIPIQKVFYPAADFKLVNGQIKEIAKTEVKDYSVFSIIYAGSLGKSYDLGCILRCAALLEESHPNIVFKIAGAGTQEIEVKTYADNHKNLTYFGRLNKDDLMKQYFHSDLGLTQHIKGAKQSVTYKLFDLLASELPILNSLESEMKDIILENKVGLHNHPGDEVGLKDNILKFYNDRNLLNQYKLNGLKLTLEKGQNEVVYNKFVDLLEEFKIKTI
jgi:glycosyltransferase involved in cell wall biosynthesis